MCFYINATNSIIFIMLKNILVSIFLILTISCAKPMNDDIETGVKSKKATTKPSVNIKRTPLKENIYFEFDSYELSKDAIKHLDKISSYLRKKENITINIEGHCDERGTKDYNLILGEKRALTVRNALLDRKISKSRMKTVSYGEERPDSSGTSERAYRKNRRAEFVIN